MFWSDTGKTWEGFAPLWNIVRCSQDTLKDSQGHSNACAYCMYLRYLWTVTMVFQVFHGLSANVYWEEFMDTSLFLALNCPNKIHDFHLYFSLRLPYMPCSYQTLRIQWPEPVLLPLAWSGHFQVQVPLLLHHSPPLPKVLLLFPADERHFFLHPTAKWRSLTWESLHIFCLLFHV